jgi:DNA transposition AAA+ family ATPase
MMGMNDQEETEVDIEEMIAQVVEAMAGGRQFDGWKEISAGRFVGTDTNRKPFGVMRVAAANAQSRCLSGDAREQAKSMVEYMEKIWADLLFVTETSIHNKRTRGTIEAVEGAYKDLGYGAKSTMAN